MKYYPAKRSLWVESMLFLTISSATLLQYFRGSLTAPLALALVLIALVVSLSVWLATLAFRTSFLLSQDQLVYRNSKGTTVFRLSEINLIRISSFRRIHTMKILSNNKEFQIVVNSVENLDGLIAELKSILGDRVESEIGFLRKISNLIPS